MARLVLFDVDGTLFRGQSQHLFLRLAREAGLVGSRPFVVLLLWFVLYRLRLVRRTTAIREYAARQFRGVEVAAVEELLARHAHRFTGHLEGAACDRLRHHQAEGDEVVLVSAALEPIIRLIARHLGVVQIVATRLEVEAGRYTGRITGAPIYGERKVAAVGPLLDRANKSGSSTVYYTDDSSDEAMLRRVDLPICVTPDRRLHAVADKEGWQVIPRE